MRINMDPLTIIGGVSACVGIGLGIGAAIRLLPTLRRAHRDLANWMLSDEARLHERITGDEEARRRLAKPLGRKRDSSIVGLCDGALRHVDGSYTCAWHAQLAPTMLAHEQTIESRCDSLARMLAVGKPAGTVVQFRYSSGPDPGHAVLAHLRARGDGELTHPEASELHANNVEFYRGAAAAGAYRHQTLSIWVRVPVKQKGDETSGGLSAFIPAAWEAFRKQPFKGLPRLLRRKWIETADDGVVRRILADEREARRTAEKVFRLIERECPLSLRRFNHEEMCGAVYLGHRQNARVIPVIPQVPGVDVRDYLCCESIRAEGDHVMHGACPAAVVSMFTPPQPTVAADALRALMLNPGLNFRHTIVAEYIYPDQSKATKQLDRRIKQLRRSQIRGDGRVKQSPESKVALGDLDVVREHVTGSREALVQLRFYVLIYGPPARAHEEKVESLRLLDGYCEAMITAMKSIPGVEAAREEPDSLRALYHRGLVGEADWRLTGREVLEVAGSLAALAPTESSWSGARRPHTLCSTPAGRLIGLDFFDRDEVSSPLALVLGQPGSGKSVLMARVINDVLATLPEASVRAVDFGESLGPHGKVVNGRHLRFVPGEPRTINIWDYPGLEFGEFPDETQIAFVVGDAMRLARVKADDSIAEDILTNVVTEVYRNEVPRNRSGGAKHEPVHSHLLAMLESYPFQSKIVADRAATLAVALEKYRGHQWIDAPTHTDFTADSPYDVYELDSLDNFQQDVRETLAGRVAARVVRSIGRLKEDGTRAPVLLVFDEVWKIRDKYPHILAVIKRGARQGRKENVVTMLATQAYEDFEELYDITRTAGIKLIGKQIGDSKQLIADAGLSDAAAAAISAIRNVRGEYAQYVLTLGSGFDQVVEMIQMDLSPAELWTFATNPDERNARARVQSLTGWPLTDVIRWLAAVYPRGLTAAGVTEIDESLLSLQRPLE
jgi:hypothetical protein